MILDIKYQCKSVRGTSPESNRNLALFLLFLILPPFKNLPKMTNLKMGN